MNHSAKGKLAVLGASVAALAATTYFFWGPEGKKHQKKLKGWMIRMKGEVVEKLENAREITEPMYRQIVDSVATGYVKGGKISRKEIEALVKDLKKHWKTIGRSAHSARKKTVRSASRVIRKTRAATKAARKAMMR